jgi:hypothetical protein
LPDAIFSNRKYQFGSILEGLARENFGKFYRHLVGIFYGHFEYFTDKYQGKSGNPGYDRRSKAQPT